jgi:hypothetical protein
VGSVFATGAGEGADAGEREVEGTGAPDGARVGERVVESEVGFAVGAWIGEAVCCTGCGVGCVPGWMVGAPVTTTGAGVGNRLPKRGH